MLVPFIRRIGPTVSILLAGVALAVLICGTPASLPLRFEDAARESGLNFVLDNSATPLKHQIETMIGGVAVLDYNHDGRPDIYFVNGARLPDMDKSEPKFWNRLYRNDGRGKFTDVTDQAGVRGVGYGMGVAVGDYDNDGYPDIYIAGANRNQLLHNNRDGTFSDVTEKAGVAGLLRSSGKKPLAVSAGWFDYNNDGLLDLFVVNYLDWSMDHEPPCYSNHIRAYCSPASYQGEPSMLFRNNGDGTFTDVSESSGISRYTGKGMGEAFADYDGDGYTDIFVANDTYRNFLFHNRRDGTFEEVGILAGIAYNENGKSIAGMGADFRDVDNDGRPDLFVTGMINDTFPLFRNSAEGFTDITSRAGLTHATLRLTGWSNGIFDLDNDGWKDLFTANAGILDNSREIDGTDYLQRNLVLRNEGGSRFEPVPISRHAAAHRGAAFADFDGDGKVDIVVSVLNGPAELLLNRSPNANHWLDIELEGTKSNRDGLGARIAVRTSSGTQYNHATTSVGYGCSSDKRVHFGLGTATRTTEIRVLWPSGRKQILNDIAADQVLHIREP
ncbi:MAG TPA: CRTAC1 family protein [Bryobacteraceae bacterium]|jgi:hypothetical protein|nr:CRTAC1 family protein [Bryobacteraceae bacterium]